MEGMKEKKSLPAFGLAEDILGKMAAAEKPVETKAETPARQADKAADKDGGKYVTFRVGSEEYGLAISQVQEINRVAEVTRVPNSPMHVKGVINLRGRIIPVIDLAAKLKVESSEKGKDSRVVVVDHGSKVLGLMVDSVSHVMTIAETEIEKPPEEALDLERNYIKGVGKLGQRMIIILDLEKIIAK